MTYQSYINLTEEFAAGLGEFLKKKEIPLAEVVEVFAGNGKLGITLGLEANRNITDSLLYADRGYEDFVNMKWERKPEGVAVETAYETVLRFGAEEGSKIEVLIMGAPLPANSYYCPSYEAAKGLYYLFPDATILYIGEMFSHAFGSPKFFDHMEIVEDGEFTQLVENNYNSAEGYFTSILFEKPIILKPYLLRFKECTDETCDCHDGAKIREDVEKVVTKSVR